MESMSIEEYISTLHRRRRPRGIAANDAPEDVVGDQAGDGGLLRRQRRGVGDLQAAADEHQERAEKLPVHGQLPGHHLRQRRRYRWHRGAARRRAEQPVVPFSDAATRSSFGRIHDRYSSILHAIKSSHGKVARKLKVVRAIRKVSRACLVMACGAAAAASDAVAAHLLFFGLLVGVPGPLLPAPLRPPTLLPCPTPAAATPPRCSAAGTARPAAPAGERRGREREDRERGIEKRVVRMTGGVHVGLTIETDMWVL
ncbi:hypothetical protein [Oryza sativa Japonica Group]|uniref:Uncharacterized protein n=1 Tax=Oryza sativa subsp. japonica TaxID=39947 RepID=Q5NBA5_ORYSJ|nr:hypothetical protein [Oryza sativa Japonica Group]